MAVTVNDETQYLLIIKGNKYQAAKAAADRKIPFISQKDLYGDITIGKAMLSPNSVLILNMWLCESPLQAPFPPGTLLYWSKVSDENT